MQSDPFASDEFYEAYAVLCAGEPDVGMLFEYSERRDDIQRVISENPPEQYGDPSGLERAAYIFHSYFYNRNRDVYDPSRLSEIAYDDISGESDLNGTEWFLQYLFAYDPMRAMAAATIGVRSAEDTPTHDVEIVDLPEDHVDTTLESMRAGQHLGELLVVDVQVSSRSDDYQCLYRIVGSCDTCGAEYTAWQRKFDATTHTPPDTCLRETCDGNVSTHYTGEEYYQAQEVLVQDLHKNTEQTQPVDKVAGLAKSDIYAVDPGEQVTIAAICLPDKSGKGKDATDYLHIVGIDDENRDHGSVDVSAEERERLEELARETDNIHDELASMIEPHLVGGDGQYEAARKAALYQLIGGVPMANQGRRERGAIHVLFMGEPSTGKSDLADFIRRCAPKSMYCDAQSTTDVGFTAAAVQEDKLSSKWTLKGGVLVKADKGVSVIEEFDNADYSDKEALYTPMSEQRVSVDKAGINATLPARTSVVAVANPVNERFDPLEPMYEQFDIPPALFSRFDLTVIFRDKPDIETDKAKMSKIRDMSPIDIDEYFDDFEDDDGEDDDSESEHILSEEEFTKYVAAAQDILPHFTEEAYSRIEDKFADIRNESESSDGTVPIAVRQGHAIRRLAQASARIRFSELVELEDVMRAEELFFDCYDDIALDSNGDRDVDVVETGISQRQREIRDSLVEIISGLEEAGENSVNNVLNAAEEQDIDKQRAEVTLKRLEKDHKIWGNQTHYGIRGD